MNLPKVSPRDRRAAQLGWCRIERVCTTCGRRVPAGAIDGTGACPTCAQQQIDNHESEET
jgi:endogenous inhibitor of DNA gyrase (YacG/DUF329 family)